MNGWLLDTRILLWWLGAPERLGRPALDILRHRENRLLLSAAAVWEMAIEKAVGRLDFPGNLAEVLERQGIEVLDVGLAHALAVADLPLLHHDPFDRLQVAQARIEGLTLITRDRRILLYDVATLQA